MRARRLVVLTFLLSGLLAGAARSAHASPSSHERVEVRPIKKGGEVVGLRLSLTLRPEGGERRVRIGLGSGERVRQLTARHAIDARLGYLVHQFPEIELDGRAPRQVSYEVLYRDAPGLVPGQTLEVVSAWRRPDRNIHVWGMVRHGAPGTTVRLPAAASSGEARLPAHPQRARAVRRAAASRQAVRRGATRGRAAARR